MAVEQKRLAFGTISGTSSVNLYTVPTSKTIRPFLVLTNTVSTIANPEVSINSSGSLILITDKIASGEGKTWRVLELSDLRLSESDVISLKLISGGPVNYFLSGIEYDVA